MGLSMNKICPRGRFGGCGGFCFSAPGGVPATRTKQGNESILKNLLEAILKIKIEKIEIQAEVELERELIDDKTGILDIEATIDDSTVIDIEMQMQNQYNMKERTLLLTSNYNC